LLGYGPRTSSSEPLRKSGERVLDVACGTGIVARLAAAAMGTGHVVGLDINRGMLAFARSQSAGPRLQIEWHEASALDLPFPDTSFDLILCQLGLQFFPDQPRALREMIRVLVPNGRLALSVFTAIGAHTSNECVGRRAGSIPWSWGLGS
jgi:ubiquinone/menaquinone biosynthesis C-methylase UbiE